MTYEEAKVLFEEDLKDGKCSDDCPECNARELAILALGKQIPKKPIENGIGGYICPHCNGVILDFTHELYHRDCGGRLE